MMFEVVEVPADAPTADEQLGTKRKFWFEHPEWDLTLYKAGRPRHQENAAERICAELAPLLGLPAARIELAIWGPLLDGVRGTVSPHLAPGDTLIFGNEVLEQRVSGYPKDQKRTAAHTVSLVIGALKSEKPHPDLRSQLQTAADQFVGYLMFDAWVSNTDRHHENWALIQPSDQPASERYLSPTFDHGSSLGRELTDEARADYLKGSKAEKEGAEPNVNRRTVEKYATGPKVRGRLFLHDKADKSLSPLDAFYHAGCLRPAAANFWLKRLEMLPKTSVIPIFDRCPSDWMSELGRKFALALLDVNRDQLLKLTIP